MSGSCFSYVKTVFSCFISLDIIVLFGHNIWLHRLKILKCDVYFPQFWYSLSQNFAAQMYSVKTCTACSHVENQAKWGIIIHFHSDFSANWVHHALQAPQSIKAQKPKIIHDSGRLEELTGEELCCCTHWKLHNAKNSHNWLTYRAISQNQLVVDERLKSKKLPKKVSRQSGCFRQSQVKDKPLMKSPIW